MNINTGIVAVQAGCTEALSLDELTARRRCEEAIRCAFGAALAEAQALLEIRKRRLYRDDYSSFENYVRQRWAMSRAHANRRCSWAEAVESCLRVGDTYPERESHARPLYDLTPEQQERAWGRYLKGGHGQFSLPALAAACGEERQSSRRSDFNLLPEAEACGLRAPESDAFPKAIETKPPMAWYGSKNRLVPDLLRLLPPHRCYVEVFGGSGALLFAKPPSRIEVFNDIDGEVVHLFETLRGPSGGRLFRQLRLTPHARHEHSRCKRDDKGLIDPVERARRFYVAVCQSYSGIARGNYSASKKKRLASTWTNRVERLPEAAERLRHVQIEALDFRSLIGRYDSPDSVFYCDPPYLPSTRTAFMLRGRRGQYRHEMTEADHGDLLDLLLGVQGKVILSGYDSPMYASKLAGWRRWSKTVQCVSATTNNEPSVNREEVVWMNF